MKDRVKKAEGRRERKRRKTREQILEAGLRLFVENGYDATTLDAIAAAAGISRRTFFSYFGSKEELLLARHDGGFLAALGPALRETCPGKTPLEAAEACLLDLASRYEGSDAVTVHRLMRSTDALRIRKDALFVEIERELCRAMGELWPADDRRDELRIVAMMVVGTLRLALDDWSADAAGRPLGHHLRKNFDLLKVRIEQMRATS